MAMSYTRYATGTTSITLKITADSSNNYYYRVFCRLTSDTSDIQYDTYHYIAAGGTKNVTISGLDPGTSYTFNVGWDSDSDHSGGVTWLGAQTYSTASIYYYACYDETSGDIIQDARETSATSIKAPTISGYTYLGYKRGSNLANAMTPGSYTSTSTTATVNSSYPWCIFFYKEEVYYTITCKDRLYSSSGTLLNTYTKGSNSYAAGTTAKGSDWGTSSSYTGYYYDSCTQKSSVSANSTVYRNFYPNSYTVKYNLNGASGTAPTSTTRYYNESYILTSTTPTRSGYTFLGWNTNSSATSGTASGGTISASTSTSTITYYAIWKQITYSITIVYNANGGSGAPSSHGNSSTSAAVSIILSSTKPTRSGYTFLGWSTSSAATVAEYQPNENVSFTGTTTGATINLHAIWKINTIPIQIHNGTNYVNYAIYIHNETEYVKVIPYVHNGTTWKQLKSQ